MLKPHCYFEILRNEKLFQLIWKQVFPENLYWVETKSITALKGTSILPSQVQAGMSQLPLKEQMIHQEKPELWNIQLRWRGTMWLGLSSFHPVTLNYEHLLVESHRCLRELNIFKRQGRHLNTLWKSWAN